MPTIRTLFDQHRTLDRQIEKVITYSRVEEAQLQAEISEYVVTDKIDAAYVKLLKLMQDSLDGRQSEIGVWVSGFYGSGKSSFSKYLGFALDSERKLGAGLFRDALKERLRTNEAKALLTAVANRFNPQVILLDLGSEQIAGNTTMPVSDVLYMKVQQWAGYSKVPQIAHFELLVERDGKKAEFEAAVQAALGMSWAVVRSNPLMALPVASEFAHKYYPAVFRDAEHLARLQLTEMISEEERVKEMIALVRRRSGRENVLFIVDEAGHYVSAQPELILNLDGLARNIKNVGQGKVWLVATAQQILAENAAALNSENLYKLKDRFPINVHLEASDIREICYRRLLTKSDAAEADLRRRYEEQAGNIRLNTELELAGDLSVPPDVQSFVNLYPFPPAQFEILVRLLGRLARRTGGVGLRSTIKILQDVLTSPPAPLADREVGYLANAVILYDSLRIEIGNSFPFITAGIEAVTNQFPQSPLHQQVAKAIAILQVLDSMPSTPKNLAAVLQSDITCPTALGQQVAAALDDFARNSFVPVQPAQGNSYRFLSTEGTNLQQQYERLEVTPVNINQTLNRAVKTALNDELPYAQVFPGKSLKAGLKVAHSGSQPVSIDGQNEPVQLVVQFESATQLSKALDGAKLSSVQPTHRHELFLVAQRLPEHLECARTMAQCEIFLQRHTGAATVELQDFIKVIKHRQENAEAELLKSYRRVMAAAPLLAAGQEYALDAARPLPEALSTVLGAAGKVIFSKYELVGQGIPSPCAERLLSSNLDAVATEADPLGLVRRVGGVGSVNEAHPALVAVIDLLQTHGRSQGKEVVDRFKEPPYGWTPDTIRYLLAALLQAGKIQLTINNHVHATASDDARRALASTQGLNAVGIEIRSNAPSAELRGRAAQRLTELFGVQVQPQEKPLAQAVIAHMPGLLTKLTLLSGRLAATQLGCEERAITANQQLSQLIVGDGSAAIASLGAQESSTYANAKWARDLQIALTDDVRDALAFASQFENLNLAAATELGVEKAELTELLRPFQQARADQQGNFQPATLVAGKPQLSALVDKMVTRLQAHDAAEREQVLADFQKMQEWSTALDAEQRASIEQMLLKQPPIQAVGLDGLREWLMAGGARGQSQAAAFKAMRQYADTKLATREPTPTYVPTPLPIPPPAPEVDFELTYPEVLRSAADVQALQGQFVQLGRLLQTSPVRLKLKQLP